MKVLVRTFNELSNAELYEIMRLRQNVFVVEQGCSYTDMDGRDVTASHVLLDGNDGLAGCCRVLPPIENGEPAEIGRFVVSAPYRRKGFGHRMMEDAVRTCKELYPTLAIRIRAQSHLAAFYGKHGFCPVGAEYMSEGIPHTDLIRDAEV